jgi:hypothetical protein
LLDFWDPLNLVFELVSDLRPESEIDIRAIDGGRAPLDTRQVVRVHWKILCFQRLNPVHRIDPCHLIEINAALGVLCPLLDIIKVFNLAVI